MQLTSKDERCSEDRLEYQTVHLVQNGYALVSTNSIVGYCHYPLHRGYLTIALMHSKACDAKNCPYFKRFKTYSYWVRVAEQESQKIKSKGKRKNAQKTHQQQQLAQEKQLRRIQREAQKIADKHNFPIIITRVLLVRKNHHIVNYVSDSQRNDFHPFLEIKNQLSMRYGGRFELRHLRLPDGQYATIADWNSKPAK